MEKQLRRYTLMAMTTVIAVILLIFIGGVVRSTGAGMGCPDWPKCFGLWAPPNCDCDLPKDYQEIFVQKRIAKNERIAKIIRSLGNTKLADKIEHDPAIFEKTPFNLTKAWIEYANRLVGVLIGFFILLTTVFAFPLRRAYPQVWWLSLLAFLLVLIEGWLGSIVVSTNLLPGMITVHMLLALFILIILLKTWFDTRQIARPFVSNKLNINQGLLYHSMGMVFIIFMQILIGSQVRESVDTVAKTLGQEHRPEWIASLGTTYNIHRAIYYLIVLGIGYWFYRLRSFFKVSRVLKNVVFILCALILMEVLFGILMHYWAIPPILQPLHLGFATLIFVFAIILTRILFAVRKM